MVKAVLVALALSLAFSAPLLAAAPSEPSLEKRALQAYRAKRYEEACPLFEQVAAQKRANGWAWNDLALCRIHNGDWREAVDSLQEALTLARVAEDSALETAVRTNADLLAKRLLAARRMNADQVLAAEHFVKLDLYGADNAALWCPLLKKASADAGELLSGDGWAALSSCLALQRPQTAASMVASVRAALRGESLGSEVVFPEFTETHGVRTTADWKEGCVALDGQACGRKLLLCGEVSNTSEFGSNSFDARFVVIEAEGLERWHAAPWVGAPEKAVVQSGAQFDQARCDVGGDMLAHGETIDASLALAFDACRQTFVRWTQMLHCGVDVSCVEGEDEDCADAKRRLSEERFTILKPAAKPKPGPKPSAPASSPAPPKGPGR